MKKKIVKNEDAPLGRNDWKGRTPRWRPSWTLAKFLILKEWGEEYFKKFPARRTSQEYSDFYDEIIGITQQMQTPLMNEIEEYPLF